MKLDYLIKRENFKVIFNKTIINHYRNVHGLKSQILWGKKSALSSENFLINIRLNIIFPVNSDNLRLKQITNEYSYNKNIFNRFLRHTYIFFSINKFTRRLMSHMHMSIKNIPEELLGAYIIPGNHSIRIVNFNLGKCLVLKKYNFDSDKITNLINVRSSFDDIPGPKLLDYDLDNSFYYEDIINGVPIDRMKQDSRNVYALAEAKKTLNNLYIKSKKNLFLLDWLAEKETEIEDRINKLPNIVEARKKELIIKLSKKISKSLKEITDHNTQISVSLTHGDFQYGNILVPKNINNTLYLIDWEYSKVRTQHYDFFVFLFITRSPFGLSKRIKENLNNKPYIEKMASEFGLKLTTELACFVSLFSFFLEEIIFRIEDISIQELFQIPVGFDVFMSELDNFLKEYRYEKKSK